MSGNGSWRTDARAVGALALQTGVVAVLAAPLSGVTRLWSEHDHLSPAASDPAAALAWGLVLLFLGTVAGAVLLLPAVVAWTRLSRPGTSRLATFGGLALAVAVPAVLVWVWSVLLRTVTLGVLALVVVAAVLMLLATLGAVAALGVRAVRSLRRRWNRSDQPRASHEAWSLGRRADGGRADAGDGLGWPALFWNYALVAAVLLGLVAGSVLGAPVGDQVEVSSGGPPATSFAFETTETADGTLLTITHDDGDRVAVEEVHVEGDLARVSGAEQVRSGPWNGSTTATDQGPVVEPGDAVTAGLSGADDCVVRVVYRDGATASTLAKYECGSPPGR